MWSQGPLSTFLAKIDHGHQRQGCAMAMISLTCTKRFKKAAGRPWPAVLETLILRDYGPRPSVQNDPC